MQAQANAPFEVGTEVGEGHTWGEVAAGDRFRFPDGETVTVKSRTKRYVRFDEHGYDINPIHTLNPGAVYLGGNS